METPDHYEDEEMPEDKSDSTDTKDDGGMATTVPRDFFSKECKVGDSHRVRVTKILEDGYIVEPAGDSDDDLDKAPAIDLDEPAEVEAEEDDPLMG